MKVMVYFHPQLVGKGARFYDADGNAPLLFEGRKITSVGFIAPRELSQEFYKRCARHHALDSTSLLRIATYGLEETRWCCLFTTDGLVGVFYLFRKPGNAAVLQFLPFKGKAIVATPRAVKSREICAESADDALGRYIKCNGRLKKAAQ